jgi:hypothetical protein
MRRALVTSVLLAACAGDPLRSRAAADLLCEEASLTVVEVTPQASKVDGCGKRALYFRKCKPCAQGGAAECDCTWEMNTNPEATP